MKNELMRLPAVLEAVSVARSTIFRWEAKGKFPARRRLGPNSIAYKREEVEAWIESRTKVRAKS